MEDGHDRDFVRDLLTSQRYLVLSTTNGSEPWVAPLEYMVDDDLNLYFLSTEDSRHARDIERNEGVAVAVFAQEQPDYGPELSARLNGVQMTATATKVPPDDYSDAILAAIEALSPPMPPYAVFKIRPDRFFVAELDNGVNVRTEVR